MHTTNANIAIQVHEPRRWPRTVSSMLWCACTRPTRQSVPKNAIMLSRGHRSGGAESDDQIIIASVRAIRKRWHGKAMRKSCAAKAVSCEGFAKAPVTGCIAMLAVAAVLAAAASRSGHGSGSSSLREALLESRNIWPLSSMANNKGIISGSATALFRPDTWGCIMRLGSTVSFSHTTFRLWAP
eukprot:scaffold48949_cov66-Phaeocystis_antarctica.AAC.1